MPVLSIVDVPEPWLYWLVFKYRTKYGQILLEMFLYCTPVHKRYFFKWTYCFGWEWTFYLRASQERTIHFKMGDCWILLEFLKIIHFLDPRLIEGSVKLPLSVHPSVSLSFCQFGVFLKNDWIVFSEFWHGGR